MEKHEKKFELKKKSEAKFWFQKKSFGSVTDTKIGLWLQFPLLKPGLVRSQVFHVINSYSFEA